MDYELEAGLFSAREVSAPQKRERFFCLAYRSGPGFERTRRLLREDENPPRGTHLGDSDIDVADSELGDADIEGPQGWREDREYADEFPAWPPGPADHAAWGRILAERPELAPALAKTQPAVRGVADGNADPLANRIDKLRAYGNAVVPLTAARAFEVLAGRIRV